jgi:hypothetical protein
MERQYVRIYRLGFVWGGRGRCCGGKICGASYPQKKSKRKTWNNSNVDEEDLKGL